eukprot:gene13207-17699_t
MLSYLPNITRIAQMIDDASCPTINTAVHHPNSPNQIQNSTNSNEFLNNSSNESNSTLLLNSNSYFWSYIHKLINVKTIADKINPPLKNIINSSFNAFILIIVIYILFLILFVPLWLISFLITSYGSFLLSLYGLHRLCIYITSLIAFPGSMKSTQKDIAIDFINSHLNNIEICSKMIGEISASLLLIANNKLSINELPSIQSQLDELFPYIIKSKDNSQYLANAIINIYKLKLISEEEYVNYNQLPQQQNQLISQTHELASVHDLYYQLQQSIQIQRNHNNRNQTNNNSGYDNNIIKICANLLKISEAIKYTLSIIRPTHQNNEENKQIQKIMKSIYAFLGFGMSLQGIELLSFPLMREKLKDRVGALPFSILGSSNNIIIDGMIIPYHLGKNKMKNSHSNSATTTTTNNNKIEYFPNDNNRKGIVLFCSPNAAFYENIAQIDINSTWFGFYSQLGYDVCVYNYRGYLSSNGSPSPDVLKDDGVLVANFIIENFNKNNNPNDKNKFIIHGGSIGGMIACHIASVCHPNLLICDRTFASLDSTAGRMLGSWAQDAVRLLGLWETNVVNDFLKVDCSKIIIQDPDDEIIAYASSLKNGISSYCMLHDSTWHKDSLPSDYQVCLHLNNDFFPSIDNLDILLTELEDPNKPINIVLLYHLYATIIYISRKAIIPKPPQIWIALYHTQGNAGQILGQSLKYSFDGFKAFITSLFIWNEQNTAIDELLLDACG